MDVVLKSELPLVLGNVSAFIYSTIQDEIFVYVDGTMEGRRCEALATHRPPEVLALRHGSWAIEPHAQ